MATALRVSFCFFCDAHFWCSSFKNTALIFLEICLFSILPFLVANNTPNANMADHSDGPELVAWKRGQSVCDLVCFDYASCVVL